MYRYCFQLSLQSTNILCTQARAREVSGCVNGRSGSPPSHTTLVSFPRSICTFLRIVRIATGTHRHTRHAHSACPHERQEPYLWATLYHPSIFLSIPPLFSETFFCIADRLTADTATFRMNFYSTVPSLDGEGPDAPLRWKRHVANETYPLQSENWSRQSHHPKILHGNLFHYKSPPR